MKALSKMSVLARVPTRIIGQSVSMIRAAVPGKLMLHSVYRLLKNPTSWEDMLTWDQSARADIEWWQNAIDNWNGHILTTKQPEFQLITDALPTGFGAKCGSLQASDFWIPDIANMSQNTREIAIHTFGPQIQGKSVQILTDT